MIIVFTISSSIGSRSIIILSCYYYYYHYYYYYYDPFYSKPPLCFSPRWSCNKLQLDPSLVLLRALPCRTNRELTALRHPVPVLSRGIWLENPMGNHKVVHQFGIAKLVNIISISLWFMVDISILIWFMNQQT